MKPVLVIDLTERWTDCSVCGAATLPCWGLPVGNCGELVPNDYEGEWGGVPACQACYESHAQGLLTADNAHTWGRRMELERRALQACLVSEE